MKCMRALVEWRQGLRGIEKSSLHAEMHKRQRKKNVIFWEKFIPGWKIKNQKHSAQQVSFSSSDFDQFWSTSFSFAETLDEEKQRINEIRMCDGGRKKRKYLRISGDEGKLEMEPRLGEERPAAVRRIPMIHKDGKDAVGEEKQGENPA